MTLDSKEWVDRATGNLIHSNLPYPGVPWEPLKNLFDNNILDCNNDFRAAVSYAMNKLMKNKTDMHGIKYFYLHTTLDKNGKISFYKDSVKDTNDISNLLSAMHERIMFYFSIVYAIRKCNIEMNSVPFIVEEDVYSAIEYSLNASTKEFVNEINSNALTSKVNFINKT